MVATCFANIECLKSVVSPAGFASFASGGATVNESHASNWAFNLRAHRDFLP
jgi:hypothetical protein